MYKNGHKKESGQKDPCTKETKEDRTITKNDTKTTDADNAEHQTGLDNIFVPQNRWSVETARKGATMRRCAAFPEECNIWRKQHHQRKKTTGTTTKNRR